VESPKAIQPQLRPGVLPVTEQIESLYRRRVVEQAQSWIGTPYVKLAARKRVGVDCAMLMVRCWVDAGVYEEFDPRPYPPDWHLHRSEERYLAWLDTLGTRVDTPQAGDLVCYKFGRCYSHSGIISRPGYVIHSAAYLGQAAETELRDGHLVDRGPIYFDLWEKYR